MISITSPSVGNHLTEITVVLQTLNYTLKILWLQTRLVYLLICLLWGLVGNLDGNRPFGRPGHKWEGNIKMNLPEVEWGGWIGLIWLNIGTGAGCCEVANERSVYAKCGEFLE